MASRHALVCLPPTGPDAIQSKLSRALNKVRGGHFDSYEITTGRYTEHFPLRDAAQANDPRLVRASTEAADHCAGGPIGLLDIAALREHHAVTASEFYDAWAHATCDMPSAQPLSAFKESSASSFDALLAFRKQPQLKVLIGLTGGPQYRWRGDEAALIALDRTEFIARARHRAVPGNSLLDLDGNWSTDPAWLNADDDAETGSTGYHDHVNRYLDALPGDHLVVGVDCRR